MTGRIDGIALIQLRPDLLASAMADAIRHTGDLSLIEPAPAGPEMLDALKADQAIKPVVVIIGDAPLLAAHAGAVAEARPDLVIVTVPITGSGVKFDIPGLALGDLINLLRWLISSEPNTRSGIQKPSYESSRPSPTGSTLLAPTEGSPRSLSLAWMDPIRRLAIACVGARDERSLPKLMVSALAAQRLPRRLIEAEAAELAADGEGNQLACERIPRREPSLKWVSIGKDIFGHATRSRIWNHRIGRVFYRLSRECKPWSTDEPLPVPIWPVDPTC